MAYENLDSEDLIRGKDISKLTTWLIGSTLRRPVQNSNNDFGSISLDIGWYVGLSVAWLLTSFADLSLRLDN